MGQRVFSNADARDLQIAIDILKAHTHAAIIPALALVKRHLFLLFSVLLCFRRFFFYDGVSSSIKTSENIF